MISNEMEKGLNDQMNFEMFSANIYLSMATYFDSNNLSGCSSWMKVQYQEEMVHHSKFYDFISERGARVLIYGIEAPAVDWESPLAAFEDALAHEVIVTQRINNLMSQAIDEKDHATVNFLNWFVGEQVEEEANVGAVIQKMKLMTDAPGGLFLIDSELSQRVFAPPVTSA